MLQPADETFEQVLRAQLPEGALRDVSEAYLEEPRGRFRGKPGLLAAPRNTEEVSQLVRLCSKASVGIVPYGGGTGLVAGQVLPNGPAAVILSLERMAGIRALYPEENVIVAEAGAVLADLKSAAHAADRLFPLSIASEGTAQIGGNLATNAGGVNVLRYGNARDLCLGLEAVLPDGQIWHGLTRLRKDNAGYDLRNLLIGSEGTLGIITAAALKLFPRPASVGAALLVVESPKAALQLLGIARDHVAEGISAFELIAKTGLEFLAETMPQVRQPFAEPPNWMVLVEYGLSAGQEPAEKLAQLFEEGAAGGLVTDGVVAQSQAQHNAFWALRENMPHANRKVGSIASHDISLPLAEIPGFFEACGSKLASLGPFRINGFGHLGDGNLHYNVFPPRGKSREMFDAVKPQVTRVVHDCVVERGGSVAAEHGVGRLKVDEIARYGDATLLSAMRAVKSGLDPKGIMNPGAVLS